MAAETGHLVLSTLHTVDAGQSINRILGLFSLGEEKQLRIRLADSQKIVAIAKLSDGTFWSASVEVVVTLAACTEEVI